MYNEDAGREDARDLEHVVAKNIQADSACRLSFFSPDDLIVPSLKPPSRMVMWNDHKGQKCRTRSATAQELRVVNRSRHELVPQRAVEETVPRLRIRLYLFLREY